MAGRPPGAGGSTAAGLGARSHSWHPLRGVGRHEAAEHKLGGDSSTDSKLQAAAAALHMAPGSHSFLLLRRC